MKLLKARQDDWFKIETLFISCELLGMRLALVFYEVRSVVECSAAIRTGIGPQVGVDGDEVFLIILRSAELLSAGNAGVQLHVTVDELLVNLQLNG